jgi:hypothetical protein
MRRMLAVLCSFANLAVAGNAAASDPSPLARAFGASPSFGAELSPDGSRVAFLRADEKGSTFVEVLRLADQTARTVLESDEYSQHIRWCRWANVTRLVCGAEPLLQPRGPTSVASLVGIDDDGRNLELLAAGSARAERTTA